MFTTVEIPVCDCCGQKKDGDDSGWYEIRQLPPINAGLKLVMHYCNLCRSIADVRVDVGGE